MTGNYFVALPVRAPDLVDQLKRDAPGGLRWFHPDDLHLTVAFFGREQPQRIPSIREVMTRIPPFAGPITLGPLVPLPRRRHFSVLSFELATGRTGIAQLIAAWRGALSETAGVRADSRPPYPHLTVARIERRHLHAQRGPILRWVESLVPPVNALEVLPPALYGWSPDRPVRQFEARG